MLAKPLSEFHSGVKGIIQKLEPLDGLTKRLMEMGFLEGETLELLHEGPIGKDPMAVRVRGGMIALRRSEASRVWVEVQDDE